MEDIRDCRGRLTCKGDAATGFVESVYHGVKFCTTLSVGAEFAVEREGVVTIITRTTDSAFRIVSYIDAA